MTLIHEGELIVEPGRIDYVLCEYWAKYSRARSLLQILRSGGKIGSANSRRNSSFRVELRTGMMRPSRLHASMRPNHVHEFTALLTRRTRRSELQGASLAPPAQHGRLRERRRSPGVAKSTAQDKNQTPHSREGCGVLPTGRAQQDLLASVKQGGCEICTGGVH